MPIAPRMATLRQWGTDFGMLSRTAKVPPGRWSACRQNRTGRLRAGVVLLILLRVKTYTAAILARSSAYARASRASSTANCAS